MAELILDMLVRNAFMTLEIIPVASSRKKKLVQEKLSDQKLQDLLTQKAAQRERKNLRAKEYQREHMAMKRNFLKPKNFEPPINQSLLKDQDSLNPSSGWS